MPDQPRLIKLLKMIMLLSSGIKYSIDQICDRLELSERTARRYIRTIRDAGFILPRPVDGLYYIDKQSPYFKELSQLIHFSREEAQILYQAIHAISSENVIKQNLVQKLYALYKVPAVARVLVNRQHSQNINLLIKAIEQKRKVILKGYQSANSNKQSDRLVEPYKFNTNYISVWAFDIEDQRNKIFKNSRISYVYLLNEKWSFQNKHKEAELDHFRMSSNKKIKVKLILSLRACELLKEEYPLAKPFIKKIDSTKYQYEAKVYSFDGVGRFITGLCDEIIIQEPEELKIFVKGKMTDSINKIKFKKTVDGNLIF